MGTEFEYAVDVLTASQSASTFTVHSVDDWNYFRTRGLKYAKNSGLISFQDPMDTLQKHHVESIKKTMQMHEDVFKQQVKELHRLYNVQKVLMNEVKKEIEQKRLWNPMNSSEAKIFINWSHQSTSGHSFNLQRLNNDISSRERSGTWSRETTRMPRDFDLERPAKEDFSTGMPNLGEELTGPSRRTERNNDGSDDDDDNEIELTLSIGRNISKQKLKSCQQHYRESDEHKDLGSSGSIRLEKGEDCKVPATNMSSSSNAMTDEDRKRLRWHFQV